MQMSRNQTATFVDSSVLLDLATNDAVWASWSRDRLKASADAGPIWINEIVFAEISIGYTTFEAAADLIDQIGVVSRPIPREAAFLAGKAFVQYRQRGGAKASVLPDFFIGAHAAILGVPLLTRDPRMVALAYPRLQLISPA